MNIVKGFLKVCEKIGIIGPRRISSEEMEEEIEEFKRKHNISEDEVDPMFKNDFEREMLASKEKIEKLNEWYKRENNK